ncbi:hypothetical protein AAZX31_20G061800 [Glycine max]
MLQGGSMLATFPTRSPTMSFQILLKRMAWLRKLSDNNDNLDNEFQTQMFCADEVHCVACSGCLDDGGGGVGR